MEIGGHFVLSVAPDVLWLPASFFPKGSKERSRPWPPEKDEPGSPGSPVWRNAALDGSGLVFHEVW